MEQNTSGFYLIFTYTFKCNKMKCVLLCWNCLFLLSKEYAMKTYVSVKRLLGAVVFGLLILCSCHRLVLADFNSTSVVSASVKRCWLGAQFWSNPMQDWQLNNGRIECISSGGDRNVFLLTHELIDNSGNLQMSVRLGRIAGDGSTLDEGWIGFKVGVRGQFNDYRDSALRGKGLCMGLHTSGRLFIGCMDKSAEKITQPFDDIRLVLRASESLGKYNLASTIEAKSPLLKQAKTATWLLEIFPTFPQYCQPTPTLFLPFFTQPLSSMINPVNFLFGKTVLTSTATWLITSRASQLDSVIKCCIW